MTSAADESGSHLTIALDAVACSNRCRHCEVTYGPPEGHLSRDEILRWRDRVQGLARDAGVAVSLGLTNTELLDHPQWRELAMDLGWEFPPAALATNARRIAHEPALIDEFAGRGLQRLQLTLGGADRATHDAFTRLPGSFDHRVRAAELAVAAGLQVTWACIACTPLCELGRISELARSISGPDADESVFLVKPQGEGRNLEQLRPTGADLDQLPSSLRDRFPTWMGAGCETEGELVEALVNGGRQVGCIEAGIPGGCGTHELILCRNGDLYPVCHERCPDFLLGNLDREGLGTVLGRLGAGWLPTALALRYRGLAELAAEFGRPDGEHLHSGCSLCRTLVTRALTAANAA